MVSRLFDVLYAIGERCRLWVTLVPGVALFVCGWKGAPAVVYMDLTAALIGAVLLLDPLSLVRRVMSPGTRIGVPASIGLTLLALQRVDLDLYFRVWLVVVAVVTATVTVLCNGRWLLMWKVKQSPHVDRVLAYLGHRGELPGAAEWARFGCRESRALLHQALNWECSEWELESSYKAIYLLAYLHGQTRMEQMNQALQKRTQQAEELAESRRYEIMDLRAQDSEVSYLRSCLSEERQQYEALREAYSTLKQEADAASSRLEQLEGTGQSEDRDAAILAYVESGHSYGEAAQAFGLSKSRVGGIVKEHRERGEEE